MRRRRRIPLAGHIRRRLPAQAFPRLSRNNVDHRSVIHRLQLSLPTEADKSSGAFAGLPVLREGGCSSDCVPLLCRTSWAPTHTGKSTAIDSGHTIMIQYKDTDFALPPRARLVTCSIKKRIATPVSIFRRSPQWDWPVHLGTVAHGVTLSDYTKPNWSIALGPGANRIVTTTTVPLHQTELEYDAHYLRLLLYLKMGRSRLLSPVRQKYP